ncbi:MAG: hypothetical protein ACLQGV_00920 [Bryobacteraceae bacterium]
MKKNALVSAFCALLFASLLVAADPNDVNRFAGDCAAGDQKACGKLKAAIRKLTDQALLAKIALESQYASARQAAVLKLTDQSLLVKIALQDQQANVRQAAVDSLNDQALLATLAIQSKYTPVRVAAINKLTDQVLLARIAIEGEGWPPSEALRKLTDQAMLAKVAIQSKSQSAGFDAVRKLTDKALLDRVAAEARDQHVRESAVAKLEEQAGLAEAAKQVQDRSLRLQAIAAMEPSGPNLKPLAGYLGAPTSDAMESAARIKLAIREPRIRNRFPLIVFAPQVSLRSHGYFGISKGGTMPGESVAFELSQAGQTLAQRTWSTVFPQQTWGFAFLAAKVDATDLLRELLRNAVFTPDDLAELSSSEIPELRQAAQERLAQIQSKTK